MLSDDFQNVLALFLSNYYSVVLGAPGPFQVGIFLAVPTDTLLTLLL